jgi:hypothetical protein
MSGELKRHFVSVRVTRHGKFRKTHFAEINAPDEAEALRHLENRCKPGGEFARKFPGATFAEFQVVPLYGKPVQGRDRVVNGDIARESLVREHYLFPYRAGIAPPPSASMLGSLITGI